MDQLRGSRVLVTGACGFVGANLAAALERAGAEVVAVDLAGADWDRLPTGARRVRADIMVPGALDEAAAGCDIVVHLAARTDLDGADEAAYAVNTVGTENVIEAAARGGARRFVHYSTQLVVGLFNEPRFLDETAPMRTKTVYGHSKIRSEQIVAERCGALGLGYTVIRPTSVYGPWGGEPYAPFFATVRRGRYVHVGRADNLVSLVHVDNLVALTLLLSTHPEAENEVFFGTDFHPYTMREVADTVAAYDGRRLRRAPVWLVTLAAYLLAPLKAMGIAVPLYPFRLRNIRMTYCYDIAKSVRLGYDPQVGLADGIASTLRWYDEHPGFGGSR